MDLNKILGQEAFFMINKEIMKKVKCNGAVLLSYFIGKEKYFRENGGLIKTKYGNNFFYLTIEKIEEDIGLSRKEQETAIKKLQDTFFIEKIKIGVPARNHFRILSENIFNFLKNSCKKDENTNQFVTKGQTGENKQDLIEESDKQVCNKVTHQFVTKGQTIYKNNILKYNNKNIIINNNTENKFSENSETEKIENFSDYEILENKNFQENTELSDLESEKNPAPAAENCEKLAKKEITESIDNLIIELKTLCNEVGVAYDGTQERNFARHILTAKEFGRFCENINQTRIEFAKNILKASLQINFWKICSGPKLIYKNYAEVYNKAFSLKNNGKLGQVRQQSKIITI